MRTIWLLLALAGCPAKQTIVDNVAVPSPSDGTSIAVYLGRDPGTAVGMIDDRRSVVVGDRSAADRSAADRSAADQSILLDRIDPAAGLQTLVIEPLDRTKSLRVGVCARERIDRSTQGLETLAQPRPPAKQGQPRPALPQIAPPVLSPLVRCTVDAAPGTYFVRVLQITALPTFKTFHQVSYAGNERATITTRFSFTTLAWSQRRADLTVFDGLPGGEVTPRAIARGIVVLDGTAAVLANPPVETTARLIRLFDGAIRDPLVTPNDPAWGKDSKRAVMTTLELDGIELTSGQVDVHVAPIDGPSRDVVVQPRDRDRIGEGKSAVQRLGLAPEDTLHGLRRNIVESFARADGKAIRQRLSLSVANASDQPRPVVIEERLRPHGKRQLINLPARARVVGDVLRVDAVVEPGATEQLELTVMYTGL